MHPHYIRPAVTFRTASPGQRDSMKQHQSIPILPVRQPPGPVGNAAGLNAPEWSDAQDLIERHSDTPGGLLPLLHDLQDRYGHVPASIVPVVARALNLSRAEVHGVLTYYHHFRSQPPGRHVLQVCRAESCKACGGDTLLELAERVLGCGVHETSPNAAVTLEPVFCLGLCASSPAIQFDGRLHARMNEEKLHQLLSPLLHTVEAA